MTMIHRVIAVGSRFEQRPQIHRIAAEPANMPGGLGDRLQPRLGRRSKIVPLQRPAKPEGINVIKDAMPPPLAAVVTAAWLGTPCICKYGVHMVCLPCKKFCIPFGI